MIETVKNFVAGWASKWGTKYHYDTIPPQEMRAAMDMPHVRETMIRFSREEYGRNPYYASVVNKQAEQVIGPCPTIIATGDVPSEQNDMVEDQHLLWTQQNSIGRALRLMRREAALTGIGMLIETQIETTYPIKKGFKVYGFDALQQPVGTDYRDRIIEGIEYNEQWEPIKFYFMTDLLGRTDPIPYDVKDVIYWSRGYENGRLRPVPECYAAFQIYPYVRRYLQAVIEGEEFRTSFPMALELDPKVYPSGQNKDMYLAKLEKFQYQPKTVPSLPAGTTLKGLPSGSNPQQIDKLLRSVASAGALCIDMPPNLALGDSSDANMATAQVDTQPWKNRVKIDRFDLAPTLLRVFNVWYTGARLIRGITPESSRVGQQYHDYYPHTYVYDPLFQHPDPQKNANAKATSLKAGFETLNNVYSEMGVNPRRQLEREARLLGLTYDELIEHILATRSNLIMEQVSDEQA